MTLISSPLLRSAINFLKPRRRVHTAIAIAMMLCAQAFPLRLAAQAATATPDVLVLSNGDTLHGKLVNAIDGKVTFHSDPLGDVTLEWDKIKELHTSGNFADLQQEHENSRKEERRIAPDRHGRSSK